jgi:HD superfamily phosphohydrolase
MTPLYSADPEGKGPATRGTVHSAVRTEHAFYTGAVGGHREPSDVGLVTSLGVLRDPLDDYIPFSRLERQVIDSPMFQRLRYVSQNALAHLTYHSNRTSRFSHSLGCMHIGGRMVQAGLRNASPTTVGAFHAASRRLVKDVCTLHSATPTKMKGFLTANPDPFYVHSGIDLGDRDALELVTDVAVLQSLRLACVIHDIGHPPFSHTVEGVLEAQLEGPYVTAGPLAKRRQEFSAALSGIRPFGSQQLHELTGQLVMTEVFTSSVNQGQSVFFDQLCLTLAKSIASGVPDGISDPEGVIPALHELVSGDLDADRADYIRRDGYACGFEFGTYDLERIVISTRLMRDGPTFKFRPTTTALSAVESFFIERLRIYRWLVFHHNVVRGHVSLQRALQLMFGLVLGSPTLVGIDDGGLAGLLADRMKPFWRPFLSPGEVGVDFARVDENWLMTLFHEVLDHAALQGPRIAEPLALLRAHLQFVCERQKHSVPLWKRLGEYQEFCEALREEARKPAYAAFFGLDANAHLDPNGTGSAVAFANGVFRQQLAVRQDGVSVWGGDIALFERFERRVEEAWPRTCPGKVIFSYAHRMKAGPSKRDEVKGETEERFGLVESRTEALVELSVLSSQVAELDSVWERDVQAMAFLIPGTRVDSAFVVEKIDVSTLPAVTRDLATAAASVLFDIEWGPTVMVAPEIVEV